MTQITFDGYRMTAKGHAGAGPWGSDVVCAGLSTLFTTAAEMLLEMRETDAVADMDVQLCQGDVVLSMAPTESGRERADAVWDFLHTGCLLLAESYPQNVVITAAGAAE